MSYSQPSVSIILSTYNWQQALERVLLGYAAQSDTNFELIIADDGSDQSTADFIKSFQENHSLNIKHVWHEDDGFRKSIILNAAVAQAAGDFLIFSDGDCVPCRDFVAMHKRYAERGYFSAGSRILLSEAYSQEVFAKKIAIHSFSQTQYKALAKAKKLNKAFGLKHLSLGPLRYLNRSKWQGVRGCNLGIWKDDYLTVNGFDENFHGWGYEDSCIAIRLLRNGIQRKDVRYTSSLLHLWHPLSTREQEQQNQQRLKDLQHSTKLRAEQGFDNHL